MSITNNNTNDGSNNNNNNNNENNKKSKENLRELSYLLEEERLLNDLKRKSEETLAKLKVEELTLLRFVRGLADASSGGDRPIMLDSQPTINNFNSTSSIVSNGISTNKPTNTTINNQTSSTNQPQTTTSTLPTSSNPTNSSTISTIEQNVNNTEVLKLNVDNILMTMDNDQENEEIEMDD